MSRVAAGMKGFRVMGKFKARSGRWVNQADDGTVTFEGAHGFLAPQAAFDVEEYFLVERDAELDRWRSAVYPVYVVYPRESPLEVRVLNERTGMVSIIDRESVDPEGTLSVAAHVALEYWEAHPIPKPWHDAEYGEVWAVTHGDQVDLFRVDSWGEFTQVSGTDMLATMPVTHASITDARKIWPVEA